jgi:hypothetical protein
MDTIYFTAALSRAAREAGSDHQPVKVWTDMAKSLQAAGYKWVTA